ARVLAAAGSVAVIGSGDPAPGRQWLEEGRSTGLEVDDPVAVVSAGALLNGVLALRAGADLAQAEQNELDLLAYTRRVRNAWGENRTLVGLAEIALTQGNFETGETRLEEAVRVARAAGDGWSLAMT